MKKRQSVPANWAKISKGKNAIYRCPILNSNKTMQCTFTGRKAQLEKHINEGKHIFEVFEEPQNDDQHIKTDSIKEKIKKLVLQTGGSLQLSLSQMSSPTFSNFIHELIQLTGNYVLQHLNEKFIPETFYQPLSRTSLKENLLSLSSDSAHQKRINLRNYSSYATLCIDAGTIENHQMLLFLIHNAASNMKPTLLYSAPFLDHSAQNFFSMLEVAIEKAEEETFCISAVVGDNVSYQKKALAHWKPNSLINQSDKFRIKSLLYITCNCHNLDLVITFMIKNNTLFQKVSTCAVLLATLSRHKDYSHYFPNAAPRVPATRWLYLFDFTKWIRSIGSSITKFLEQCPSIIKQFEKEKYQILKDVSIDDFIKVHKLIKPLRKLNDKLESDCCTISYVVPLVESTLLNSMMLKV